MLSTASSIFPAFKIFSIYLIILVAFKLHVKMIVLTYQNNEVYTPAGFCLSNMKCLTIGFLKCMCQLFSGALIHSAKSNFEVWFNQKLKFFGKMIVKNNILISRYIKSIKSCVNHFEKSFREELTLVYSFLERQNKYICVS